MGSTRHLCVTAAMVADAALGVVSHESPGNPPVFSDVWGECLNVGLNEWDNAGSLPVSWPPCCTAAPQPGWLEGPQPNMLGDFHACVKAPEVGLAQEFMVTMTTMDQSQQIVAMAQVTGLSDLSLTAGQSDLVVEELRIDLSLIKSQATYGP